LQPKAQTGSKVTYTQNTGAVNRTASTKTQAGEGTVVVTATALLLSSKEGKRKASEEEGEKVGKFMQGKMLEQKKKKRGHLRVRWPGEKGEFLRGCSTRGTGGQKKKTGPAAQREIKIKGLNQTDLKKKLCETLFHRFKGRKKRDNAARAGREYKAVGGSKK